MALSLRLTSNESFKFRSANLLTEIFSFCFYRVVVQWNIFVRFKSVRIGFRLSSNVIFGQSCVLTEIILSCSDGVRVMFRVDLKWNFQVQIEESVDRNYFVLLISGSSRVLVDFK